MEIGRDKLLQIAYIAAIIICRIIVIMIWFLLD
jgi:hypothetical protein